MEMLSNISKDPLPGQNRAAEQQFSRLARKVTELSDQAGPADEISDYPAEKYGIIDTEDQPEAARILDSSEQQIIDMMFQAGGQHRPTLYGPRKAKPAIIGNFLDLRG